MELDKIPTYHAWQTLASEIDQNTFGNKKKGLKRVQNMLDALYVHVPRQMDISFSVSKIVRNGLLLTKMYSSVI